jgi:hypothetical protein
LSTARLKKSGKPRLNKSNKVSSPKKFNSKSYAVKKPVVGSINFRYNVDKSTAKREIEEFINKHPWSLTSEIIENLHIEPPLAVEVLTEQ